MITLKNIGRLVSLLGDKTSLRAIKKSLVSTYLAKLSRQQGMREIEIDDIVEFKEYSFSLNSLEWRDGHVTRLELLYILAIIKSRLNSGKHFLEIGTFDGNTALNICHNLPEGSKLYTIDLPEEVAVPEGSLGYDTMLIDSEGRKKRNTWDVIMWSKFMRIQQSLISRRSNFQGLSSMGVMHTILSNLTRIRL